MKIHPQQNNSIANHCYESSSKESLPGLSKLFGFFILLVICTLIIFSETEEAVVTVDSD